MHSPHAGGGRPSRVSGPRTGRRLAGAGHSPARSIPIAGRAWPTQRAWIGIVSSLGDDPCVRMRSLFFTRSNATYLLALPNRCRRIRAGYMGEQQTVRAGPRSEAVVPTEAPWPE